MTSVYESISYVYEIYLRLTDIRPLTPAFPKWLLTEYYLTRTILLASFTLGIRVGGLSGVYSPIRDIFGCVIVFLFTYLVLPCFGFGAANQFTKRKISLHEFRVVIIAWSFVCGLFSMVANIHYSLAAMGPPTYFMPVVIGLTVQIIGSRFDNDRQQYVGVCVGSATAVSIALLYSTGEPITFSCIFSLILSTIHSMIVLQFMIYDLLTEGEKREPAETHAAGVFLNMFNFLLVARFSGQYTADPAMNDIARGKPLYSALIS